MRAVGQPARRRLWAIVEHLVLDTIQAGLLVICDLAFVSVVRPESEGAYSWVTHDFFLPTDSGRTTEKEAGSQIIRGPPECMMTSASDAALASSIAWRNEPRRNHWWW